VKKLMLICIALGFILSLNSVLFGQIKNDLQDDGTAIAMGSSVKLNASGEILVCGDNDILFAGVVVAVQDVGGTDYYLIASSDIYPAKLDVGVTAGDSLTTSAGGTFKTMSAGEIFVGYALEDGHATDLRKAIFIVNKPIAATPDDDWTRVSNMLYTYYTTDSVAIGMTSAANKLDIDGGALMRGDRYWGIDTSEADSFWIYDDGDSTYFDADNPIRAGDGLILETDGDVMAMQEFYVGDVPDAGTPDSVLIIENGWIRKEAAGTITPSSLQNAYVGGNTISMSAGEGDIVIYNDDSDTLLVLDESNGYVEIGGNTYIGDSLYFGDVEVDTTIDSILVLSSSGKVSWAPLLYVGGSVTCAYGEIVIDNTSGVYYELPGHAVWVSLDSAVAGVIAGAPYLTAHTTSGADSIVIGTKGATIYQMNVSISFKGASGTEFVMAVALNDTRLNKFTLFSDVASDDEMKSASLSGLINLNAGDVLTLYMQNRSGKPADKDIYIQF